MRGRRAVSKHDLLFHAVHGLCRVTAISRSSESDERCYELLPVLRNRSHARYIIPESVLENSGFDKLITVQEANSILEYFKTGEKKGSGYGPAWAMAALICSESCSREAIKEMRKRQKMAQCVRGLSGQLAYVLQITLTEACERIRKNLRQISAVNPLVLAALTSVEEDEKYCDSRVK